MISLTGGFNQQFVAGAPKVSKTKYARDTMVFSDAVVAIATIQHFKQLPADTLTLTDAIETDLALA